MALYNAFSTTMDDLYDFIETKFPRFQKDVELSRFYTSSLKCVSKSLFVQQVYSFFKPYRQEILDCNQQFFLHFESNINHHDSSTKQQQYLTYIRDVWLDPSLTELDKARIWYFFHQFIKIADKLGL